MGEDKSPVDYGSEFKEEVRSFFKDKFKVNVFGGPNFHIAPDGKKNQIDACFKWNDTLLIFECKAAGKRISKSMHGEILKFILKAKIAHENYHKLPEFSKCKYVRFIFLTKKILLSEVDQSLLKDNKPSIYYADDSVLEYYSELHDKIGEYALYNFLADFEIFPPYEEDLQMIALSANIKGYSTFLFYADPKKLLKFSYVARRRYNYENFYQRMLERKRIINIQKFIDEKGGIFPTDIILSIKRGYTKFFESELAKKEIYGFPKDIRFGRLNIKKAYDSCWIIDGQHRLYSFAKSKSNCLIPCLAFENIGWENERRFFLEINREQKPIPSDLIWDLEGQANPQKIEGIISNIVKRLNNAEKSPFYGLVYIPLFGSKSGKIIKISALCNGIYNSKILTADPFPNNIGERRNYLLSDNPLTCVNRASRILRDYFDVLCENLPNEQKKFVLGNAGSPIMLYLLEPILSHILFKHPGEPRRTEFVQYAKLIKDYFDKNYPDSISINALKGETTSEGSRRILAKRIGQYIRSSLRDNKFWITMEESDIEEAASKMERRIGGLIGSTLNALNKNWQKQRVQEKIRAVVFARSESEGSSFEDCLNLGQEKDIIVRDDNWNGVFKDLFVGKNKFQNIDELKLGFDYLSKVRAPAAHKKRIAFSDEFYEQCKLYLKKFDNIVPETTDADAD